ncbi:MAG TPA: helix-turn-helix domain-containing protein [Smithella sp.]|nr:helix-turn-helix domain-containing protein [Smithella sp.]
MTRTEKSNHIKNKIIEIARQLFVEQGYQKTTIRQIIEKAGINTGTLYHFFRDKEDIFLRGSEITDFELVALVERLTANEKDYVLKYAVYFALEFKMVEKSDKIAELYLESYCSLRMTQMAMPIDMARNKLYFHEYNKDFTKQDYYRISLALRGMRLMFVAERVHTGLNKFKEDTPFIIDSALRAFNVPKKRRDEAIAKAMDLAKKRYRLFDKKNRG